MVMPAINGDFVLMATELWVGSLLFTYNYAFNACVAC